MGGKFGGGSFKALHALEQLTCWIVIEFQHKKEHDEDNWNIVCSLEFLSN